MAKQKLKEKLQHNLLNGVNAFLDDDDQTRLQHGDSLRHKLASKSARMLLSSQVWLNALPTEHCDVLVVFPIKHSLEMTQANVIWFADQLRLKETRLKFQVKLLSNTDSYGVFITAKHSALLQGAELIQVRKKVKECFGGGLKDFVFDAADCYENVYDRSCFFTSQQRASIVRSFLLGIRLDVDELLPSGVRTQVPAQLVAELAKADVISHVMPLHNTEALSQLKAHWLSNFTKPQPLDKIYEYYGEKVAMYFAWLGFYTTALLMPAFLGLLHWLFLHGLDQFTDDICVVSFAFVNIIWATVYLEACKRKQAELAYKWGTLNMEHELLVDPRPRFKGDLVRSAVTGRLERYYPSWKRRLFRYGVSYPVTMLCILAVFCLMLLIFELEYLLNRQLTRDSWLHCMVYTPKILLAVVITLSDTAYSRLAVWLNEKENYRSEFNYENHLITKVALFQFINSFLSLFFIAFYIRDMDRLSEQLATLLITRQVIGNLKEAVLPWFKERWKISRITYKMTKSMSHSTLQSHISDIKQKRQCYIERNASNLGLNLPSENASISSPEEPLSPQPEEIKSNTFSLPLPEFRPSGPELTQAEMESLLPKYDSPLEDYLEMYVQFGYVLLFSPSFPLAALCALLNNVIEIHVDAFKLCSTFRRPFGARVESIGQWQTAMEMMGIVGVMVNCALIGQSGLVQRFWPNVSLPGQIVFIVILEHLVLGLKYVIAYAIPDIPNWITVELAKMEFKRREAFKKSEANVTKRTSRNRTESLMVRKSGERKINQVKWIRSGSVEQLNREAGRTATVRQRLRVTDL